MSYVYEVGVAQPHRSCVCGVGVAHPQPELHMWSQKWVVPLQLVINNPSLSDTSTSMADYSQGDFNSLYQHVYHVIWPDNN